MRTYFALAIIILVLLAVDVYGFHGQFTVEVGTTALEYGREFRREIHDIVGTFAL